MYFIENIIFMCEIILWENDRKLSEKLNREIAADQIY